MSKKRFVLHNLKAIVKIVLCLTVLSYLSWTYRRNILEFLSFMAHPEHRACVYKRRNYELQEKTFPLYVTLTRHGRLGNWLYGYSALLGVARANGYVPYLEHTHPLNHYFELSHVRKKDAECLFTVYDDLPCSYIPSMMKLPHGNISIEGYIQSWKYFQFMEDEIRKELKMNRHLLKEARNTFHDLVGKYIAKQRLVISIHVRRGDVLKPEARKLGFCHAPKEYFDNAIQYMANKFPHSVFLVMSDDIAWCKESIKSVSVQTSKGDEEDIPIVFSGNSPDIDFGMLTLSNHSIVSVGTFGWWGAWLANGHVVYYKDFPIPGTKVDYELNKEDFYPSHWVALSNTSQTNPLSFVILISLLMAQLFTEFNSIIL